MNKLLLQFFAVNKKLSIPGVGTFVHSSVKAEDNFGNKTITPSTDKILFLEETDEDAKEKFELFAVNRSQKSSLEIIQYYQSLAHTLNNENRLNIDGLGVLAKENGSLNFQQTFSALRFFPEIQAEKIVRADAEHTVKVGENERTSTEMKEALAGNDSKHYWWVYVLIVLLIAGAGYGFYYFYFQKR